MRQKRGRGDEIGHERHRGHLGRGTGPGKESNERHPGCSRVPTPTAGQTALAGQGGGWSRGTEDKCGAGRRGGERESQGRPAETSGGRWPTQAEAARCPERGVRERAAAEGTGGCPPGNTTRHQDRGPCRAGEGQGLTAVTEHANGSQEGGSRWSGVAPRAAKRRSETRPPAGWRRAPGRSHRKLW